MLPIALDRFINLVIFSHASSIYKPRIVGAVLAADRDPITLETLSQ